MKKLTGFITLWVVFFSILWILDENGLFSYRTIEIFFGEELSLPEGYSTEKVDIASLGRRKAQKQRSQKVSERDDQDRKETPMKPRKIAERNTQKNPRKTQRKTPEKNSLLPREVRDHQKNTQKNPRNTQRKEPQRNPTLPHRHNPREQLSGRVPDHILPLYHRGDFFTCLNEINTHVAKNGTSAALTEFTRKCEALTLLIEDLPQKANFTGKVTYITMSNGKKYVGKVVENGVSSITFQGEWGTFPLPKSRIARQAEVDVEFHRSQLAKKYKVDVRTLSPKNFKAIMDYVGETFGDNMPHLIVYMVEILERRNLNLIDDLLEYKAGKIYRSYLWCQTMGQERRARTFRSKILDKYPRTQAAKDLKAQSTQKAATPARVANRRPQQTKKLPKARGKASKIVAKANKYYSTAYKHLKKSFPGQPNADRELAKAKENFQEACKYYQKALSLQPNNTTLQKQLQQSMEYYHHCIKQTRLE
ncbi:tetratricopeptide repeat protein [Candidatus Uabimicrobium amorphum]|uniref:Tetratricopeptide repeat protein n=1 Tax=Uabimicrobium amorphum TaxID=2596890 RepID=A0A5S9F431_UABAM|nr:hypothetical protein [Candidatus Uabimicrobium amorphum]BBM85112.1 hypothetical protein UABAM_03475 [Candidatus Uabimicrobium amorphum]